MNLVGGWGDRLARRASTTVGDAPAVVRIDVAKASAKSHTIVDAISGGRFLAMVRSIDISAIAVAVDSDAPTKTLPGGSSWTDMRALRLQRVSLAVASAGSVILATLDLASPGVLEVFAEILRLRVPFVLHDAKPALCAMWNAGLDPDLFQLYDTQVAAAAMALGRFHKRSATNATQSDHERILAEESVERQRADFLSLDGQAAHYSAACAERAEVVLRIYTAQAGDILRLGLASHLYAIEFPFVITNARIEWHGVHIDTARRINMRDATAKAAGHYGAILERGGVTPPSSRTAFLAQMEQLGLADLFPQGSLTDSALEAVEPKHELIRAYRLYRRYSRLAAEDWIKGLRDGQDGRVHPQHHQLGAATGRNTCTDPNIAGIGRLFRPVVSASPFRAIVELDFAQIEVGVAGAEHNDSELIAAFNTGDVYAAMAQRFYTKILPPDQRAMSAHEFKRARPELRERMKVFVLAVLYNMQPKSIAASFDIPLDQAERERKKFLDTYPTLRDRLEESSAHGFVRRYASTVLGLRRLVEPNQVEDSWTTNYLRNTPIQGSAAVVFKRAVNELDRAFRGTNTWVILPVHDAVVIECDHADLNEVCARAKRILEDALHSFYPKLKPRVEVNRHVTSCWNKNGRFDSVDRFLADPTFTLESPVAPVVAEPREMLERDGECGPRAGADLTEQRGPVSEAELERFVHYA